MRMTTPTPGERLDVAGVDLFDADIYAHQDPHLLWQTLREECPVYWNARPKGPGFWAVTRHAQVRDVLRDHERFTSEGGTVLWMLGVPDPASGRMMAVTDPPRHGELRAQIGAPFAPQVMPEHDDWLRALVRETIAPLWDGGTWDVAASLSRLPVATIVHLMRLPEADIDELTRLTYASIAPLDPHYATGSMQATLLRAHHEIVQYFTSAVEERRSALGADLLSVLAAMELDGSRLPVQDVVVNCYSLLLGAAVTTSQAMTGTLLGLVAAGGGEGRWDPDTPVKSVVEEALRWSSPTMHFMRYATEDTLVGDTEVRAGDAVVAWIASANRDPRVFDDPHTFDPRRTPNRHIAFGSGVHRCVGHPLARLTLTITAQEFFAALDSFALDTEPVHLVSNAAAGVVSAPMRFQLRDRSAVPIG